MSYTHVTHPHPEDSNKLSLPFKRMVLSSHVGSACPCCPLMSLPDEIFLEVICNCSIDDLLSFRLVCKRFESLVSRCREAWLRYLVNLPPTKTPCLIPGRPLSSYTTAELKDLYIKAIRRWKSWYSFPTIVPTRRSSVTWEKETFRSTVRSAWLIPGSPYIVSLATNPSTLTCYDVQSSKCTFSQQLVFGVEMAGFDIRYSEVIIGLLAPSPSPDGTDLMLQIRCLNTVSMTSNVVMEKVIHRPAEGRYARLCLKQIKIEKEYAQVVLTEHAFAPEIVYLFRWTTGESVKVDARVVQVQSRYYHWAFGMRVYEKNLVYISGKCDTLRSAPIEQFNGVWSKSNSSTDWKEVVPAPPRSSSLSLPLPPPTENWLLLDFSIHPSNDTDVASALIYLLLGARHGRMFLVVRAQPGPRALSFHLDKTIRLKYADVDPSVRPCARNGTTVFQGENRPPVFFRAFALANTKDITPSHVFDSRVRVLDVDEYSGTVLGLRGDQFHILYFD